MRSLNGKKRLTWRSMPVLLAGLLAGSLLVQPAVAHVKKSLSHLTKHLDPRYYNVGEKVGDADTLDGVDSSGFARTGAAYTKSESDARYAPTVHNHDDRYFTEAESDTRYINTAEKAADSDLLDGIDSGQFVQNQGVIRVPVLEGWVVPSTSPVTHTQSSMFSAFTASAATSTTLSLFAQAPASLYGKSLSLTGMEVCYDATGPTVVLDRVRLFRWVSTTPGGAGGFSVVDDQTDQNDSVCRTYSGTAQTIPANGFVEAQLLVDWSGAGIFRTQRVTFFLQPTNIAAREAASSGPVKIRA